MSDVAEALSHIEQLPNLTDWADMTGNERDEFCSSVRAALATLKRFEALVVKRLKSDEEALSKADSVIGDLQKQKAALDEKLAEWTAYCTLESNSKEELNQALKLAHQFTSAAEETALAAALRGAAKKPKLGAATSAGMLSRSALHTFTHPASSHLSR